MEQRPLGASRPSTAGQHKIGLDWLCDLPGHSTSLGASHPEKSSVITACAAAKVLQAPKFGSATPFVVLTRAADKDEQTPHPQNGRLRTLLQQYEDVFLAPILTGTNASTLGDLTPECIPITLGSTSYNSPPFRLSPREKAEIERQVVEALGNGRIERSSSAYGAPVLFVPKPDGTLCCNPEFSASQACHIGYVCMRETVRHTLPGWTVCSDYRIKTLDCM